MIIILICLMFLFVFIVGYIVTGRIDRFIKKNCSPFSEENPELEEELNRHIS